MFLHEVIEFAAGTTPEVTALVAGDRRFTFADLHDAVARTGTTLSHIAARGERIAWFSDNRPELVVALSAVPRAGAILVPGNIRHTPSEQARMLDAATASVVIGSAEQLSRLAPHAGRIRSVRRWYCLDGIDGDGMDRELPHGTLDAAELAYHDPEPPRSGLDEQDPAWLIHTSGTTGRARGALLTHRSILAAALNTSLARPVLDDDVYLFPFPLFHVAAYNVVVHHLSRRPVVLLPRFDASAVLSAVRDEAVTTVSLAPTMLAMLLDHPERRAEDLRSLRRIGYGAAAMPLDLLRRALTELPEVGLAQGYGMTELSGNAVFLGPDEHRRAAAGEPWLLTAAGRPSPLAQLRIVDDDGIDVAPGSLGEILVKGDQVSVGYWDDPGATAESRFGDWLRTGDVGRIDDDGYLYVVDRKKDLVITGGENVSSREVEDVLSGHPDVAAVAVIGLPDPRWGERVCAVVVWSAPTVADDTERCAREQALIDWTDGRLAGFKRPRQVVSVVELPLNASGKVDKRSLRDQLGVVPTDLDGGQATAAVSARGQVP